MPDKKVSKEDVDLFLQQLWKEGILKHPERHEGADKKKEGLTAPDTKATIYPLEKNRKLKEIRTFPIVKIDRTTAQSLLPMLMNKGIFSNYTSLESSQDILEREKTKQGKYYLNFNEQREILRKAGEYRQGNYVIRDYGDYAIGFSAKLYIDYIENAEDEYNQKLQGPTLFPEMNKNIEEVLKQIKLYKIAHKLALIILSEVYTQKRFKGLTITKEKIVELLGYTPQDKQIYQDIKEALLSLRWTNYIYWDYTFTSIKRKKEKGKMVGNFIYNLKEDSKGFVLDINEKFIGCMQYFFDNKSYTGKERKELFERGYYKYPIGSMPLTKNYSTPAYLLNDFLLREKGNIHLREKDYKVIAYKIDRYIKEAGIDTKLAYRNYETFLSALQEVEIIEKTKPEIGVLKQIKPSKRLNTILYIWITHPEENLNKQIELKLEKRKGQSNENKGRADTGS